MRFLLALLVALLLPSTAAASVSNDPLSFRLDYGQAGHRVSDPVDYLTWCGDCILSDYTLATPWTVNPHTSWPYGLSSYGTPEPGCMWDSDDWYSWVSSGNVIASGASLTITECRYGSTYQSPQFQTDIVLQSPSADLIVTETWTSSGATVTTSVQPVYSRTLHAWSYFDCIASPQSIGDAVTIPDSHGGQAIPQLITVTVSNPGQKAGKTGGMIEGGQDKGSTRGCVARGWRDP